MRRRSLLRAGASLAAGSLATGVLAGCGFHPAFAPAGAGLTAPNQAELAAIEVPVFPERSGMLMRQALQTRLDGPGNAIAKRYRLIVQFNITSEGISIQPDNSTARIRMVGSGRWTLYGLSPTLSVLSTGDAHSVDGLNPIDNQAFAQDEETETVTRRLANNLADQIVLQLAAFFDRRDTVKTT